jgi:hypothetical protein
MGKWAWWPVAMNKNRVALFATAIALTGALSACGPTTDEETPADDVATSEAPAEETDAPEDELTEEPSEEELDSDAPAEEETPAEEEEAPAEEDLQ